MRQRINKEKEDDVYFMNKALQQARLAAQRGEVPVGAVLVAGSQVIARGYNQPIKKCDPTAHAEIVAMRKATRKIRNYRLEGMTLYVTMEPCPMCLGAMIQARIKRLVYGTEDQKSGAVVSRLKFDLQKANHRLKISDGICQLECGQLLKDFFQEKRLTSKTKARSKD
ncbi:MAG: tRNA adenosine(34) deaminase TadA [Acidobacteriota bacterium]|nr:tRNA adenosine(34) deaminase TadA [Acidobacteriota bacterium]MDW3229961.1 tRNA adenosine(34) deaminase TadA [Acidobacteriota bacterium]